MEGSLKIYGLLKPHALVFLHLVSEVKAIPAVEVALICVDALNISENRIG